MTERLTTTDFWSEWWEEVRLPHLIDTAGFQWWSCVRMMERIMPSRRARFLEVGSGTCQWLVYFSREFGYEVWGMDNALRACQIGAANLAITNTSGTVVCGDLLAPPFQSGVFDVVYSHGVVEHFENVHTALSGILPLVAPGGYLVTLVPNMTGLYGFLKRLADPDGFRLHHPLTATDLSTAYRDLRLTGIELISLGSVRIPRIVRTSRNPVRRVLLRALDLAGRVVDKTLTTSYRLLGKTPEAPWLSALLCVVGTISESSKEPATSDSSILACPRCSAGLQVETDLSRCTGCGEVYPLIDKVPLLLPDKEDRDHELQFIASRLNSTPSVHTSGASKH